MKLWRLDYFNFFPYYRVCPFGDPVQSAGCLPGIPLCIGSWTLNFCHPVLGFSDALLSFSVLPLLLLELAHASGEELFRCCTQFSMCLHSAPWLCDSFLPCSPMPSCRCLSYFCLVFLIGRKVGSHHLFCHYWKQNSDNNHFLNV